MVIYAYLRVSTEDQSLGIAAQSAACGTFDAAYIDRGVSGASEVSDRPGLSALLATLQRGDVVVAAKRDRFARDLVVMASIEALVRRAGASLRTPDTSAEGTPEAVLMSGIVDVFARHERLLIQHRTRAALAAKRARGELTGTAPYGWRVASDGSTLEPCLGEQTTRAIVTSLRADGRSMRWIAEWLDAAGLTNRAGNAWHHQSVARILGGTSRAAR